mgnify:CR=1 FL=1
MDCAWFGANRKQDFFVNFSLALFVRKLRRVLSDVFDAHGEVAQRTFENQ